MEPIQTTNEYIALLAEIKARIRTAQYDALKAVNKEIKVLSDAKMKKMIWKDGDEMYYPNHLQLIIRPNCN